VDVLSNENRMDPIAMLNLLVKTIFCLLAIIAAIAPRFVIAWAPV